nr:hypothetical protein [Tanacetum cinerariifolium]
MKKLKGYVRNKAKPEGSIVEGYVEEEELTFSSHYFRDVTTKFNRPGRNVDPPPPMCKFQVFRSVCKSIGLRSVIRFDAQELKKVKWYVLHNSPEIDTYQSQFKSLFPNKDMKEEFPDCLNDLDNATLHIDGLSTEVDAPPDIIDISADVARSHGGNGGSEDRPPPHYLPTVARVASLTEPNLGGRAVGRLNTRDKTRNLSLKEITDTKGPFPIRFEVRDKQTLMPLGEHAAHWSSYIGEVIRGVPLYHPSWLKVLKERKATLIADIGFESEAAHGIPRLDRVPRLHLAALAKSVQYQQGCFQCPSSGYRPHDRDLQCGEDQEHCPSRSKWQNQAKSTVISPQGSRSLARLRDEMSSTTQEYPSLIDTFFVAHIINGEFLRDEDQRIYEEMRRLAATGTYIDDEINRLAKRGKQRGHIPSVGRVLPTQATASLNMFSQFESVVPAGVAGAGTTRTMPTIRTTRMRMAMAIVSCVIYGPFLKKCRLFPGDMSPRKAAE